ncbi:MAG: VOC family protein [Planctomycetota bacterium]|nr:VOC family protein [Planctomycetota bacterium]
MRMEIETWIGLFEEGRIGRRELIGRLGAVMAVAAGCASPGLAQEAQAPEAAKPTFVAKGLNHIALRSTDLERSKSFYERHLGLKVLSQSRSNVFMDCGGNNFVAFFKSERAGMDHYCYTIERYDQKEAAKKLRAVGIEPRLAGSRIYFDDPDGLEVQLAGPRHWPVQREDD